MNVNKSVLVVCVVYLSMYMATNTCYTLDSISLPSGITVLVYTGITFLHKSPLPPKCSYVCLFPVRATYSLKSLSAPLTTNYR